MRGPNLRGALLLTAACASAVAFAQTSPPTTTPPGRASQDFSLFATARPQATVVIREHPTGADLVEITMMEPGYPLELLRNQATKIGEELGSAPRGLNVFSYSLRPNDPEMTFARATFGVDGLADKAAGTVRLNPIVRGLMTSPEPHRLRNFSVLAEGFRPGKDSVRVFRSAAVEVQSQADQGQVGLEYRIAVTADDPAAIDIPEQRPIAPPPAPPKPEPSGPDLVTLSLIGASIVALLALVYSAIRLLKPSGK